MSGPFGSSHFFSTGAAAAAYTIDNSCIFNDDDSSYLHRTPGGDGNLKTWTVSFWMKRANLGGNMMLMTAGTSTVNKELIRIDSSTDKLSWILDVSSAGKGTVTTDMVFRDPTAWYHIVVSKDAANAQVFIYVNGSVVTTTTSVAIADVDGYFNATETQGIGGRSYSAGQYFDGYFTEFIMIDGSELLPSSFGEFNSDGVWIPVDPSALTFGTNGFWLDFEDSSDLGNDVSGNNNDYTSSGLAAGDQTSDSPTDSGTTIGNYAIWNPLFLNASMDGTATNTYSNGNRTYIGGDAGGGGMPCSTLPMAIGSNSYYVEVTYDVVSAGYQYSGLSFIPTTPASGWGNIIFYAADDGKVYTESGSSTYGDTWGAGDAIGIYYDNDNDELSFYKNGVDQGVAATSLSSNGSLAHICCYFGRSTDKATINSGQSAFIGTAPEGALPLCTANLPAPTVTKPTDQFLPIVYEGNGTSQRVGDVDSTAGITGLIVYKNADATDNWVIQDRCQGIYKWWPFNIGAAQATDTESTQEFLAGGTTIGDMDNINTSGESITGRMWANDGTETTNAVGTITTTKTRVNDDAGFSMTIYNGTGANATVGHGLSAAPGLVIVSNLPGTTSNVAWSEGMDATDYIEIDGSGAATTDATAWNSTAPSATVVSLGSSSTTNDSGTAHIMYCWRAIEGYSYFGTHPGNGFSDGPFIYIGHAPAYFFQKNISGGEHWLAVGNDLNSYNPWSDFFSCNIANATRSDANMKMAQIASGIKVRGTEQNVSGSTYTIWSWAIHPFGGSGVAQGKAR